MKASKYSEIHSADQLQAAIGGVRAEIKAQKKLISVKCDGLRVRYRPSNIVAGFLRKNSDYYNWADASLRIVRALRSRIAGKNRPQEPENESSAPCASED